jgi:hypothetical protein
MHIVYAYHMQRESGISGEMRADRYDENDRMPYSLHRLMQSKYSDIILLGGITFIFGMLLAVSAIG